MRDSLCSTRIPLFLSSVSITAKVFRNWSVSELHIRFHYHSLCGSRLAKFIIIQDFHKISATSESCKIPSNAWLRPYRLSLNRTRLVGWNIAVIQEPPTVTSWVNRNIKKVVPTLFKPVLKVVKVLESINKPKLRQTPNVCETDQSFEANSKSYTKTWDCF